MNKLLALALTLAASPAFAASGPFFSNRNTNFIVLLAFLLFIAILVYFKVPGMIAGLLDRRAETIRAEIDEARALRDEAQQILASYERKSQDVKEEAAQIVTHAKKEAAIAAEVAKEELKASIARRLAAAEDQIKSAEAAAIKEVRDTAVSVAIGAAQDLIVANMKATDQTKLIDAAIADVGTKLQ